VEPEIPQNTGSIARLCAATGIPLHLVGRLGFSLDSAALRRAGLDYWEQVCVGVHRDFESFLEVVRGRPLRLYTRRGKRLYTEVEHTSRDVLVYGSESAGLPEGLVSEHAEHTVRVPVREGVRSLNLAAVVHLTAYHALYRMGFPGL